MVLYSLLSPFIPTARRLADERQGRHSGEQYTDATKGEVGHGVLLSLTHIDYKETRRPRLEGRDGSAERLDMLDNPEAMVYLTNIDEQLAITIRDFVILEHHVCHSIQAGDNTFHVSHVC